MEMQQNVKPDVKIIVATHKAYRMPQDSMYHPLHVGAEGKVDENGKPIDLGYTKDNTGDHISEKNSSYCELTGLYWAWKNLQADYIGLVHYRRHFTGKRKGKDPFDKVLTFEELFPYLDKVEIFVPKKRHYFIETLYSHYAHTHYAGQLDAARRIIMEKTPEYITAYHTVVNRTWGYMFNMIIMRCDWLDQYCTWLFDILFELENRIDASDLSFYQGRFYGRVSEILFNVWLEYQLSSVVLEPSALKELPYLHLEKINWTKKGGAFLKAKFGNQKYEGSF